MKFSAHIGSALLLAASMAQATLPGHARKSLVTSRGFRYTYYTSNGLHHPHSTSAAAPDDANTTTLLFLHGFPDDAHLWEQTLAHLDAVSKSNPATKYRTIVPDLLGYDGTDKPTDPAAYEWALQVQDLTEILDAEGAGQVIPVGHDWGSTIAQRVALRRPERVVGLVLLSVAYFPPDPPGSPPFNLTAVNEALVRRWGYPLRAYWEFFSAPDAPALMSRGPGPRRVLEGFHGGGDAEDDGFAWTRAIASEYGATRAWAEGRHPLQNQSVLQPYAARGDFARSFVDRFRRDGFAAPLQWYVSTVSGLQQRAEFDIPAENYTVRVPVLYVGSTGDPVSRHEYIEDARPFLPNLENHVVGSNHWIPYDAPETFAGLLDGWLGRNFPTA